MILKEKPCIFIAFYTPEEFEKLLQVADDKEKIKETFEEWLEGALGACSNLEKEGMKPIPHYINVDELEKWCKENKVKNTSQERSKYVIYAMTEK